MLLRDLYSKIEFQADQIIVRPYCLSFHLSKWKFFNSLSMFQFQAIQFPVWLKRTQYVPLS